MLPLILSIALAGGSPDSSQAYLYRTLLIRAAPGSLLEVMDRYRNRRDYYEKAGDAPPFIMRHSQGDHWDLMLLFPMGTSFQDYYSPKRTATRQTASLEAPDESEFEQALGPHVAWREETYVLGPPLAVVDSAFSNRSYYHVEMFVALPGKRDALLEQRRMENAFYRELGRPQNLIFTRVAGGAWDSYTVGFYQGIQDFAASADIPEDRERAAALAAGFEGADRIGTYLRTLMAWHHDTLARRVP